MSFPEPTSIPEYQAELLRAWGAILRVEEMAQKAMTAVHEAEAAMTEARTRVSQLQKAIQGVKNHTSH